MGGTPGSCMRDPLTVVAYNVLVIQSFSNQVQIPSV